MSDLTPSKILAATGAMLAAITGMTAVQLKSIGGAAPLTAGIEQAAATEPAPAASSAPAPAPDGYEALVPSSPHTAYAQSSPVPRPVVARAAGIPAVAAESDDESEAREPESSKITEQVSSPDAESDGTAIAFEDSAPALFFDPSEPVAQEINALGGVPEDHWTYVAMTDSTQPNDLSMTLVDTISDLDTGFTPGMTDDNLGLPAMETTRLGDLYDGPIDVNFKLDTGLVAGNNTDGLIETLGMAVTGAARSGEEEAAIAEVQAVYGKARMDAAMAQQQAYTANSGLLGLVNPQAAAQMQEVMMQRQMAGDQLVLAEQAMAQQTMRQYVNEARQQAEVVNETMPQNYDNYPTGLNRYSYNVTNYLNYW